MTDTTAEDDELLAEAMEAMDGSDFYERLDMGEGEIAAAEDDAEDDEDDAEDDEEDTAEGYTAEEAAGEDDL